MKRPDGDWWCACHGWQEYASYKAEGDKCPLAVSMVGIKDGDVSARWRRRGATW